MALIYVNGDTEIGESLAKEIAETLVQAYPNHSWWVEVRQGALIIKHFMLSGLRGTIGMVRHLHALHHDAKVRKADVLRAAGELLERANLVRGAWDGTVPDKMELEHGQQKHWIAASPIEVTHDG